MTRPATRSWLVDLDGVLIHAGRAVAGAPEFVERLHATATPYVVLTNNSLFSPAEQSARLSSLGLTIPPSAFWTSALATARFLASHRPGATAYVVGRSCLSDALQSVGIRFDLNAPDVVVLGETQEFSFEELTTVIRLIERGAHFVSTNPEPTGPDPDGPLPACGAVSALVERATGISPYVVGKPNPLMLAQAMAMIGAQPDSTTIVGDRMQTDIAAGVALGLETILTLSGVTARDEVDQYVFHPDRIIESVGDLVGTIASTGQ